MYLYNIMKSLKNTAFFYALITIVSLQNCTDGCFECDSSKICLACTDKFQFTILGQCVQSKIDRCNLYLNSSICLNCEPTYLLVNNICVKDYSGCYKNLTASKCQICSSQFILLNGTCKGIFNCVNYTNKCNICDKGFNLLGDICIASSQNCVVVNRTNGICIVCQNNYILSGYQCVLNIYYNPNCQIFDKVGRCLICKKGYTLYQSNCFAKTELQLIKLLNKKYPLLNVTINDGSTGFSPSKSSNDSQKESPINNSTNSKKLNQTSNLQQSIQKDYCRQYYNVICISCYSNFHLQNGVCKPNNPLCRQIYTNGSCKSCYQGYLLTSNTCKLIELINQSTQNQNKQNQKILSIPKQNIDPYCSNFQKDSCIACMNGYYLNIYGLCSLIHPNCFHYNPINGVCTICLSPYILMNGQCIYPIINCLLYDQNDKCYQCSQGYKLSDNVCYPNDVTCATYSLIGVCTKCIDTYYLINNQCIYPALGYDPYCKMYTNSYCTSCIFGYYLLNYKCVEVDAHCLSFNYVDSICEKCDPNLTPQGSTCN